MTLQEEIRHTLNKCCAENVSNTPDFILAEYLMSCLDAFEKASNARDKWYAIEPKPGWNGAPTDFARTLKGVPGTESETRTPRACDVEGPADRTPRACDVEGHDPVDRPKESPPMPFSLADQNGDDETTLGFSAG